MTSATIVIPTYNRAHLLAGAIESCLAQGLHDLQIIVVDDGSTDDSQAVLSTYAEQLKTIRLTQNSGVQIARNRGLQAATGAYVKFLDSDDQLLPDSLARELALGLAEAADIVVSGWRSMDRENVQRQVPAKAFASGDLLIDQILQGEAVHTSAALYRLEYLHQHQLIWDTQVKKFQDWDFFAQAALRLGKIVTWPGYSYQVYGHSGPQITDVSLGENAVAHHRVLARLESRLAEMGALTAARQRYLALYHFKELQVLARHDAAGFSAALKNIERLAPNLDPREGINNPALGWLAKLIGLRPALSLYARFRR